ncbi:MAG TPA: hypothetical protein EYP33_00550 [Pyrodictium sp.]|nr:hypothetical protein [Pyrodictium sp.]
MAKETMAILLARLTTERAVLRRIASWPWIEAETLRGVRIRVHAGAVPRRLLTRSTQLLLRRQGLYEYRLLAVIDASDTAILTDSRVVESLFPHVAGIIYNDPQPLVKREQWINGTRVDYLVSTDQGLILVEHKTHVPASPGPETPYPPAPNPRLRRQLEVLGRAAELLSARAEIVIAVTEPRVDRVRISTAGDPVLPRLLRVLAGRVSARAYRVRIVINGDKLDVVYGGEVGVQL